MFTEQPLLIIDDNPRLYKSLEKNFQHFGYRCYWAASQKEALDTVLHHYCPVVMLDIMLGEENGIDVLKELLKINPHAKVIMITGYGTVETAVQSLKEGACDYIQKPLDFEILLKLVEKCFLKPMPAAQFLNGNDDEAGLPVIGKHSRNAQLRKVYEQASRLAATKLPILITGENGTGKELLADYIHALSTRAEKPFIKTNCAAFPDNLLDNELFGHEKGAFTGAHTSFIGVFEKADKGTLLLDELGDLAPQTQAKILRALQNQEIKRLGASVPIKIDVRFIAATNKDLSRLIHEEKFRKDLYYRLNAAMLQLPPLRERLEDLPLLMDYFIREFRLLHNMEIARVSDSTLALLYDYHWPGNIRELKNTMYYAAALCQDGIITNDDLPARFQGMEVPPFRSPTLEDNEKKLIQETLAKTDNNKKKTAEILKISRKTLYNKLSKYEITE